MLGFRVRYNIFNIECEQSLFSLKILGQESKISKCVRVNLSTHSHACTLTCFAFFPTDFRGKESGSEQVSVFNKSHSFFCTGILSCVLYFIFRVYAVMFRQENITTLIFSWFRLTNRFHVAVRLFSNRSQMTSKSKNKKGTHEGMAECVTDVLTTF